MSAAPLTAEPGAAAGPQGHGSGAWLLGLVRKLIAYGAELGDAMLGRNSPTPPTLIAFRFGTFNMALVIARITRGIFLAMALEDRLLRYPPDRPRNDTDRSATPARPRAVRRPPIRRIEPSQEDDDAALLRAMPSAKDIAQSIRGRTAGEVIADICRDLGIDASHPLFRDIKAALAFYGGSLAKVMKVWMAQGAAFQREAEDDPTALAWPSWLVQPEEGAVASTGPP